MDATFQMENQLNLKEEETTPQKAHKTTPQKASKTTPQKASKTTPGEAGETCGLKGASTRAACASKVGKG